MTASDNWTPAIGLRRLALSLLLRMAICLILWAGLLAVVAPLFRSGKFVLAGGWFWVLAIPPGLVVGFIMSWRLSHQVGFSGLIPAISSAVVAVLGIVAGSLIVQAARPFAVAQSLYFIDGLTSIFALAMIVKILIVDD